LKILIIIENFPPDIFGGYELRCEETCYWLHQRGYEIEVLTTRYNFDVKNHPFPVHRRLIKYLNGRTPSRWKVWENIYYALLDNYSYSKVFSHLKPDLVYVWKCSEISRSLIPKIFQSPTKILVDISAKWFHKVATKHGSIYKIIERKDATVLKQISINLLSKILTHLPLINCSINYRFNWNVLDGYFTSHWNKVFHKNSIPNCNKFEVIHTGIDINIFPFKGKIFFLNKIKLLFVGRISEDKGFFLLLKQINQIKSINIILTAVGNFSTKDEKDKIKLIIIKMGLEDKVEFLGEVKRDKLFTYYHQNHFTIFPSICDEAFSRIPLESMACGTPCISTDNPGSKELFDLDAPLILLERSKDGLAKIIDSFEHNEAEYIKKSINGRKFIEESFTFDHFMKKVEGRFLINKRIKQYENRKL